MSTSSIVDSRYVALVFGASEAHLVPMYSNLRQRPYPPRNFFSDESGYLIPNVSIPLDVTAARESQRPPEYGVAFDWRNGTTYRALPTAVQRLLAEFGAVRCPALHGDDDYWQHLDHLLEPAREPGRLLAGLSDDA
jgi:hypothetical protein